MDWKIKICALGLLILGITEIIHYYKKVKDGSHIELPKLLFYSIMATSGFWALFISILWR